MMDTQWKELEKQIIYKLGSIESQVTSLSTTMHENFAKLSELNAKTAAKNSEDITQIQVKVEQNEKEIQKLKDWRNTIVAKAIGAASTVGLAWVIFGEKVVEAVGASF